MSSATVPATPAAFNRAIMAFGRVRLFTGYHKSSVADVDACAAAITASGTATQSGFCVNGGSTSATTVPPLASASRTAVGSAASPSSHTVATRESDPSAARKASAAAGSRSDKRSRALVPSTAAASAGDPG